MKILYHHRVASKDGQYVHIAEIVASLEKLGHQVIMCEPDSIKNTKFGGESKAVERMRSHLPGFVHEFSELLYSVFDYWKLRRLIKKYRPDCIYERYNLFFLSGIWASKRFNLPIIVEINSPLFQERSSNHGISLEKIGQWSEDYVWKNADAVLPVTKVLAKMVRERGVDEKRIAVIPNGINSSFRSGISELSANNHLSELEGKLVLGFTGFVREWHRLDNVLEVIASHMNQPWHLLLVGDGPDRARLMNIAQKLGVEDRFTITGIVDRSDIPAYLNRFDIALQPDVVPYASPLKLFEYMALGKAIIAPDMDNIREILVDNSNALLFADTESFDRMLVLLCENSELRTRLGIAASGTIDELELYWDANANKIVSRFSSLLTSESGIETTNVVS